MDENESPERARALFAGQGRDRVLVFDTPALPGRQTPRVFADGLAIPLGVLPYRDGVFVGHGRDILFLRDTDGDGKADKREVVLTGFGIQDSHLFPHQFTRGPGEWFYLAQGAFNYSKVKGTDNHVVEFNNTKMARFRADGTGYEIVCWGPNNIWGFVINRQGEMFIQEANDLGYPCMPFFIGAAYPGIAMHKPKSYAPFQPPTATNFAMGGTGLSGLALSEDRDGFPPPYRDVMYVANPITRQVQALKIHRDGPHYRFEKLADFVNCSDPWFRPVAIHFGPDSCLYIVDWYNKIISHNEVPRDHPDRDKTRGRIWRVRHTSMKRRLVPDLTRVATSDLSRHLDAPNTWEARAARFQMIDRKAVALAPKLKELAESGGGGELRINALWTLEGLSKVDLATLRKLAGDADRSIRREAARVAGNLPFPSEQKVALFAPLTDDPDPQVRAGVLRALGAVQGARAEVIELLARMGKAPMDGPIVRAQQESAPTKLGAAHDRDFERYLARAALEKFPLELEAFLDSPQAQKLPLENRVLASLALPSKAAAARLAGIAPQLQRGLTDEELALLAQHAEQPAIGKVFADALQNPATQKAYLNLLLKTRDRLDAAGVAPIVVSAVKSLLAREPSNTNYELLLRLAGAFRLQQLEPELVAYATRKDQTPEGKRAGLKALREIGANQPHLFAQIALSSKPSDPLQRDAILALASCQAEQAMSLLIELWPVLPAGSRKIAVDRMASSKASALRWLQTLKRGDISKDEVDEYAFEKLKNLVGDDPYLAELEKGFASRLRPVLRLSGHKDDYLDSKIDLKGPFTVETWIKLDSGIDNNDGILGRPGGADLNFFDGHLRFYGGSEQGDRIIAKRKIEAEVWTHVALTRNPRGEFRIYLDGELDNEQSKPLTADFTELQIGRTSAGRGTAGVFTEYRVWNVERSAGEIRETWKTSFEGEPLPAGLAHYFSATNWPALRGQARLQSTTEFPPLIAMAAARELRKRFDSYRQLAAKPGDVAQGRVLFQNTCLVCHNVQGEGGQIGPSLNGAGAKGLEALLHSVLMPSEAVESGYYTYRIETTENDVLDGFLASQDERTIILRQPNTEDLRIPRSKVKHASFLRTSMMPEGLLDPLKPQEVSNLFSYLLSLK